MILYRYKRTDMKRLLMIIDMQKGFCVEGHSLYIGQKAQEIIPVIGQLIDDYNKRDEKVVFTGDFHDKEDAEFEMFPEHCVIGTEEVQIIPELYNTAQNKILIQKTRYSGFYQTNLEEIINDIKPDLVELAGVCTNICVFFTCEELRNRDYKVRVIESGVASFDEQAHHFALNQMKTVLGAEIAR